MHVPVHPGDALTRVLASADGVEVAGRDALALLGTAGAWRAGVLWLADDTDGLLRAAATWAADDRAARFVDRSARLALPEGDGLPGRALAQTAPVWHPALLQADGFPRRPEAETAGLGAGVLAPVAVVSGRPVGVLELTGDGPRAVEEQQLVMLATAARQLAQFVQRIRAEEGLRSAEELRGAIVAAALDCIVTADHHGRIIDFNPAAEQTFGIARADALGRRVGDVIVPPQLRGAHDNAFARWSPDRESPVLDRRLELEGQRADGSVFPVELTVTRLGGSDPPVFAGFIRDLTARREAERELARLFELEHDARLRAETAERTTRRIADVLQRSLLPPHLPVIGGLELAATYRAGSDQADVGGDFYDVFELSPDRWGVVIGDVCGKGPEAAAITALARYTVRTAAVGETSPVAVLQVLNDALLRDTGSEAFCTAVYATLDLSGPRPELCMSVAGHPPPLVIHPSGAVVQPAVRGTLLGVVPSPRLTQCAVVLDPGDTLLLYTDGLVEGRTADGRFDVAGLSRVLSELGGLDAPSLVARVEDAVIGRASRVEDDVAVLAMRAAGGPAPERATTVVPREVGGASDSVSLSLPAEPASVPDARRAVVRLAQRALGPDCVHRVATAVTEAVANVVVHAYRGGEAGTIDVTARLEDDQLVVVVEDTGCGVTPRDDSPGLGLGLALVEHCTDQLDVSQRAEGGARVRMRFRSDGARPLTAASA